jgi:hypothetical protein
MAPAHPADDPQDAVVVTGSREDVRREILTFVHKVTRLEGEFVARWRVFVCPNVVGVSDTQAQFVQRRLIEVQNTVRKRPSNLPQDCRPNLFVINYGRSRPSGGGVEAT